MLEWIIGLLNGIGVIFCAVGLIVTWRRNNRDQKDRDERIAKEQAARDLNLQSNQTNILKRLDDPDYGLAAINRNAQQMKVHCAEISTELSGRVTTAERDIRDLKAKKRGGENS